MKNIISTVLTVIAIVALVRCDSSPKAFKIKFDSSKEVSGQKFAIRDISPGLPADWDDYNFVVIEFKSTTSQRFHIGFTTDYGYNELRIMTYVANGWNKLAIPLKFYRELPDANVDLAATFNQPRYTGWINLGGNRNPLHGVDSIGVRMRAPIGNPEFEIRSISLSVEDPGDQYLGDIPAVDEFGQWNLGEYEGKVKSLEQLKSEWEAEDSETVSTAGYNYSNYGGYLQKQVKATGFFRTEQIDGRWWFVDPEGYLFLSVGIDCVNPGGGGNARDIDKRRNMYKELPPAELGRDIRSGSDNANNASFGLWNLYRRYGDDYKAKSNELAIKRMDKWGLNTIANWSSAGVYGLNRKAFMLQLRGIGIERGLMGLSDVYAPDFAEKIDSSLKTYVSQYKDNPWLLGYFVGNEPAWLEQEERLCSIILEGEDSPIKAALTECLQKNGDTPELRKKFIYNTFSTFLQAVKKTVKKYDPNHLHLGIRFGNITELDEELLKICKESFDVLSFNCYALYPDRGMMDRALRITGLPMIIGEYHFGTVDRGMAQSLWQVNSQQERGVAYRHYTETAYSHPGLIGTAYFQWCDQDLTGRRDGENYNCGLIDVTDRPYKHQVEAMMETARRLYAIHVGELPPVTRQPERARGHGAIPDVW
ncbi:MAG: hypothetical protein LBQ73_00735 [Tannerellaceae bacterium]|jgi:hypothetical protein|nr:hypothetical protein [Tannerellaceae bacterium]